MRPTRGYLASMALRCNLQGLGVLDSCMLAGTVLCLMAKAVVDLQLQGPTQ
jgi:hypothetical protein